VVAILSPHLSDAARGRLDALEVVAADPLATTVGAVPSRAAAS